MTLAAASARLLPLIEDALRAVVTTTEDALAPHYGMMAYHLGFLDRDLRPTQAAVGKRVRPLLCLLACEAVGGEATRALPAAAAIELLHNFSLIHDDIEDGSPTRRHRETVWRLWGVPQAINVGDGLFVLARLALLGLRRTGVAPEVVLEAAESFERTCQALTEGQYLDMAFEERVAVSEEEYLRMIAGKTGALIGLSAELGARIGGASPRQAAAFREFGLALGRGFQIQDDILGIWGEEAIIGKSAQSDILSCKKSLPLVHALRQPAPVGEALGQICRRRQVEPEEIPQVLYWLERAGSRAYAEAMVQRAHAEALDALEAAQPAETAALRELAARLAGRAS